MAPADTVVSTELFAAGSGDAVQRSRGPGIWLFDPDRARIAVKNAEAVLAQLPVFLAGWPLQWSGPAGDTPCDIELREETGAIVVARAGTGADTQSFAGALDAANGLATALVSAFTVRDARTICLHAAAVAFGGGLALFIGDPDAGSSVSLDLAVRGYTLFGDDRIGLRIDGGGTGICLGLMPKARLPLPPGADHRYAAFIDAFSALQTADFAHLRPPAGVMAAFADERPVSAIFLLERRAAGEARIAPAAHADVAAAVLRHALAPHIDASALTGQADALAETVPGFHLSFCNSRDAADAVATTLGKAASP
jgi:hypothetical protein